MAFFFFFFPSSIELFLLYDDSGCIIRDELGKILIWCCETVFIKQIDTLNYPVFYCDGFFFPPSPIKFSSENLIRIKKQQGENFLLRFRRNRGDFLIIFLCHDEKPRISTQ